MTSGDARPLEELFYTSPDSRYICWKELQAKPDTKSNKLCCHRRLTNTIAKIPSDHGSIFGCSLDQELCPVRNAWFRNVQALPYRSNEPATFANIR